MIKFETINFFGLTLTSFKENELSEFLLEKLNTKKTTICFGYSLGTFPYLKDHPEIAEYSNTFDLMVCDGRGIFLLARSLGFPLYSDISIPNLTWKVLELANKHEYSVLIAGSSPENNVLATNRAQELYPNARFVEGNDGGDFSIPEQKKLVNYVNQFNPDILLIGVSSPKKEAFVFHFKNALNTSLIIPFGGAIDILSGKSKPIPKPIKKMLLGSVWRWVQEPKRLFRDSIIYPINVLFKLLPTLLFYKYIKKASFSIVEFYSKKNSSK